jgi:hypothetical protein
MIKPEVLNMVGFVSPKKFDELKTINYDSIKEFVALLSAVPGSLKTELTGEELAKEIIKGAMLLKKFIIDGAEVL